MIDPKYVLQATGMVALTASTDKLAYYGIIWTTSATPFSITIEDWFGNPSTFDIDKYTPAIAPKKVTNIAVGNTLYLLHNGNKSSLPG